MKVLFQTLLIIILFSSCQEEKKAPVEEEQLTIAEKIADAHGIKNWDKVKTFAFTFGGKIDEPNSGRSWIWNPKTNDIKLVRNNETTQYNRNNMDSIAIKVDRAFINDKFWALIPFQLIWDEGASLSEPKKAEAPISKKQMNSVTLLYSDKGGYTPGDAYDIYYDDNFIIQEWAYRGSNASEASLINTFEKYDDFGGLKIAQEHKKAEGEWNLLVRHIKVELEE